MLFVYKRKGHPSHVLSQSVLVIRKHIAFLFTLFSLTFSHTHTMSAAKQIMGKLVPLFSNAKPYILMIALQFGMAGNYIFGKDVLNHGMSRFVFIVYRNAMATIALAPFAFFIERSHYFPYTFIFDMSFLIIQSINLHICINVYVLLLESFMMMRFNFNIGFLNYYYFLFSGKLGPR